MPANASRIVMNLTELIAALLVSLVVVTVVVLVAPTEVEYFCFGKVNYNNTHGFTDEEHQAWALSCLVRDEITYQEFDKELSLEEIVRNKLGDCDELTLLYHACAGTFGIESRIVEATNEYGHHKWIQVYLDGRWRNLDPNASEEDDYFLFIGQSEIEEGG